MKKINPLTRQLILDRGKYTLTLYTRRLKNFHYKPHKVYDVAIGQDAYQTPSGLWSINHRSRCPEWMVPDSPWAIAAGLVPGTVYNCHDPANPIKGRWLGVTNPEGGIGVHGTADDASIGYPLSHGCIRMHIPDVEELFPEVPRLTPIYLP